MADPTLKDVLTAITRVETKVDSHRAETGRAIADTRADIARVETDLARVETNMRADIARVETRVARVEANVAQHRAEFAELDRELTQHAGVHREIERDIASLLGPVGRDRHRSERWLLLRSLDHRSRQAWPLEGETNGGILMATMDPYAAKLLILAAVIFVTGLIGALRERRQSSRS